jgi:hypothetical protein
MTIFFALLLVALVDFILIGVEWDASVIHEAEVGNAAYAAALSVASRINIPLYRETGQTVFLLDVFDTAQAYASTTSSHPSSRSIPVPENWGIDQSKLSDGFHFRSGQSSGLAANRFKLSKAIYRYRLRERKDGRKVNIPPEKIPFFVLQNPQK